MFFLLILPISSFDHLRLNGVMAISAVYYSNSIHG